MVFGGDFWETWGWSESGVNSPIEGQGETSPYDGELPDLKNKIRKKSCLI